MRQLQENAVGIALYDAGHGRQAFLAQRVGALLRPLLQLAYIGHELPRDWIACVGAIDQLHQLRRNRDRVARGYRRKRRRIGSGRKPRLAQRG